MALALSYCGLVLVFLHDLGEGRGDATTGSLLMLGAVVCYAIYLLGSGELVRRIGSLRLVSYAMSVSSVACIAQFFVLRPAVLPIQSAEV